MEVLNYVMMDIHYQFFVLVQLENFSNLFWIQRLPTFPCGPVELIFHIFSSYFTYKIQSLYHFISHLCC